MEARGSLIVSASARKVLVTMPKSSLLEKDSPRREFGSVRRQVRRLTKLTPRQFASLITAAFDEWTGKRCDRHGAALAFYTVFSLAPLLIVVVAVGGFFFGAQAARGQIVWQLQDLIGRQGGEAVQFMLQAANKPAQGIFATVAGVFTLVMSASLVVAELRDSLDTIWDVPPRPSLGLWRDALENIRRRLFAFSLVLGIGFLLLVSLVLNALLAAAGKYFQGELPAPEVAMQIFNFLLSLAVTSFVFSLIFRFVPETKLSWGEIAIGSGITGVLFSVGKSLISLYIGKSTLASAYGAAGSLAVLLAWFYYSAQIFFFGAAFVRVYSRSLDAEIARQPQRDLDGRTRFH